MAFNYQHLAKTELSFRGINPAGLIENYPNQLKRMALEHDMGEISFQSPVARQLTESAPGDEAGRMKAYAEALIEEATHSFPPKAEYFGVDVGGKMADSIGNYLIANKIKDIDVVLAIPKEHMDRSVYFPAVQANPEFIKHVPPEFQHYSMQKSAAQDNPDLIKEIEYSGFSQLGHDDFIDFIEHHGAKLSHFPDSCKNEDLFMAAVRNDAHELRYIPDEMINKEILMEAVNQDSVALDFFPDEFLNEEFLIEIVEQKGMALNHIPPELRSEEMCLAAVRQNGFALEYVPEGLRNEDVCVAAVRQNIEALEYVPVDLRDEKPIIAAVEQAVEEFALAHLQGMPLKYVPDAWREDIEIASEALGAKISEVANDNVDAYQVHEQLKSGELKIGDMSEQQMELMQHINFEVSGHVDYEGASFDEAFQNYSTSDSGWLSAMDRVATVEMESAGGLKMEFCVQTEPSNGYQSVETLRDFYDCNVGVNGSDEASIAGNPVHSSDIAPLADALRVKWEDQVLQEVGQIPEQYEAIADRSFTDLAIDNTLDVSRNETGDLTVNFSVEDPYREGGVDFTMKAGDPESLTFVGQEPSEAGMSLAETYVAENEQMLAAEVAEFKLQEVGLSNIEVDFETVEGAGQVYFATFNNNGEPGYVGLDSETLKIDSESNGYDQLSEAQIEVLSAELEKHTEGMTPPMGIEMAERKAEELGELLNMDVAITNHGDGFILEEREISYQMAIFSGGRTSLVYDDDLPVRHQGNYSSASELNQALDSKILEARESISFEREEPKQEIERPRQEEPERRGMRI